MEKQRFELHNMKKSFDNRTILEIDHIQFEYGKRYAIIGENGAGKSTLLKIIAGVMKSECKDFYRTEDVKILYLPQKPYIFDMSVMRNIKLSNKKKSEEELELILEEMGIRELKHKNAVDLSGGEKQRLAFARILGTDCSVLLLDEPSSAMDVKGTGLFESALRKYQMKYKCTVIMTTHDLVQAKRIADEVVFMKNGKVIKSGAYKEVFSEKVDKDIREYAHYFIEK